jgi:acetyl esterase/lipase
MKGTDMARTWCCAALTALLLAALAGPARAEMSPETVTLWPNGAPGEKGDVGPEKQERRPSGNKILIVTNVTQPTLTVFRPPADRNTGTAVVICPGGAYRALAWDLEGTEVAEWLNSLGVTGIVLKYRVPERKGRERYAAPLQDAQRALGIVRHRAREWGINPDRIGILGFSAGGHLSATLSNNYDQRTYDPVDDADRVRCRPDFAILIYPAYLATGKDSDKLAPELKVTKDTPPTFIVYTEDDPVHVECALVYYLALKKAKVPAEMHVYPKGGHGYGLRPSANLVSHWPQRAEEWMRTLGLLEAKK